MTVSALSFDGGVQDREHERGADDDPQRAHPSNRAARVSFDSGRHGWRGRPRR